MKKTETQDIILPYLHLLGRVVSRPYFGRLWIVQESCIAKDVIATVGNST